MQFISSQGLQFKLEFRGVINGIISLRCNFEFEPKTYSRFVGGKFIKGQCHQDLVLLKNPVTMLVLIGNPPVVA